MKSIRLLILLIIGLIVFTGAAMAQSTGTADDDMENHIRKIAHQLRCPTCQALSVKESEAGLSLNMKSKIRELIEAGKTDDEVLDFFVERYGEWILRSPTKSGFNLLLWLMPAVLILVAFILVVKNLRKKNRGVTETNQTIISDEADAKINADLKRILKK